MLCNICISVLSNILGGVFLAILFFLVREKFFGVIDISGKWYFEKRTEKTAYNPYKNMVLQYVAVICKEGNNLYGSVEKVYENSITGERKYIGKNRTRGQLTGMYEKKYFSKDQIYIHIIETSKERESTSYFSLSVENKKLHGTFCSFVADQEGKSVWQRNQF